MPFEMVRNDITKMDVDAIVNAANRSLLGGGGVDGAIHRAAGPRLLEECRRLGGCETGQAKLTRGYDLPARYVIHTVGPIWQGGQDGERELLARCYRNSLELARAHRCRSIAFPLISAGAYGYPKEQALSVAVEEISRFLLEHDMTVYLVLFGHTEFLTGKKLFRDVQEYIDDVYADSHYERNIEHTREVLWHRDETAAQLLDMELSGARETEHAPKAMGAWPDGMPETSDGWLEERRRRRADEPELMARPKAARQADMPRPKAARPADMPRPTAHEPYAAPEKLERKRKLSLPNWKDLLKETDEGFSNTLLRLIDEKGMTDAECYKRANVDRKLFSKIRSNHAYKPSKATVLAFAVALELTLPETNDLLRRAGFALTRSSKFDIILEYCIRNGIYNIYEINEVLFQFDMPLLGSAMN